VAGLAGLHLALKFVVRSPNCNAEQQPPQTPVKFFSEKRDAVGLSTGRIQWWTCSALAQPQVSSAADRSHTTFYWYAIVNIALSSTRWVI